MTVPIAVCLPRELSEIFSPRRKTRRHLKPHYQSPTAIPLVRRKSLSQSWCSPRERCEPRCVSIRVNVLVTDDVQKMTQCRAVINRNDVMSFLF
jgi:hypothetical protein